MMSPLFHQLHLSFPLISFRFPHYFYVIHCLYSTALMPTMHRTYTLDTHT